jgi:hypothetical protein
MCILRVELSCVCRGILWVVKAHTRSAHLISRLARKSGEGGQYENILPHLHNSPLSPSICRPKRIKSKTELLMPLRL